MNIKKAFFSNEYCRMGMCPVSKNCQNFTAFYDKNRKKLQL